MGWHRGRKGTWLGKQINKAVETIALKRKPIKMKHEDCVAPKTNRKQASSKSSLQMFGTGGRQTKDAGRCGRGQAAAGEQVDRNRAREAFAAKGSQARPPSPASSLRQACPCPDPRSVPACKGEQLWRKARLGPSCRWSPSQPVSSLQEGPVSAPVFTWGESKGPQGNSVFS